MATAVTNSARGYVMLHGISNHMGNGENGLSDHSNVQGYMASSPVPIPLCTAAEASPESPQMIHHLLYCLTQRRKRDPFALHIERGGHAFVGVNNITFTTFSLFTT